MAQPANHSESRQHEKGLSVRAYQTETKCKLSFKDRTDVRTLQRWETKICLCLSSLPLGFTVVFYRFNLTRGTLLLLRVLNSTNVWEELCSSKNHIHLLIEIPFFTWTTDYSWQWLRELWPKIFSYPGFWCLLWSSNFLEHYHWCPTTAPKLNRHIPFPNLALPKKLHSYILNPQLKELK